MRVNVKNGSNSTSKTKGKLNLGVLSSITSLSVAAIYTVVNLLLAIATYPVFKFVITLIEATATFSVMMPINLINVFAGTLSFLLFFGVTFSNSESYYKHKTKEMGVTLLIGGLFFIGTNILFSVFNLESLGLAFQLFFGLAAIMWLIIDTFNNFLPTTDK